MGRPLKQETIELMNLTVSTKNSNEVLKKQVGYNKYITDQDNIVRLSEEVTEDYDASLDIDNNGKKERVLKILRNIFQTEKGIYAYKLEEDGIVFADENVTISKPVAPEQGNDGDSNDDAVTQVSTTTSSTKKSTKKVVSTEVNE